MERPLALVVDRDPATRAVIRETLAANGRSALEAEDVGGVAHIIRDRAIDLVVIDPNGLDLGIAEVLGAISNRPFRPVVVALSDAPDSDGEMIRAGAFDVLRKPLAAGWVEICLERALRQCELMRECSRLRELHRREGRDAIVGTSAPIQAVRDRLKKLATSRLPLLVTGESGVGKALVARTLHDLSTDVTGEFVTVRCSLLGAESWESRWKGDSRTTGLLDRAGGGTLYLEELPDLQPELQARLLRTLAGDGGAGRSFRVVASSTRKVERLSEDGELTAEVLRTLAGETLHVPPLRERAEDIVPLARHFVATICEINDLPEMQLETDALALLERQRWPANVRELRSAIEHAVILAQDGTIRAEHLPGRLGAAAEPTEAASAGTHGADRCFREAKREVVESFERAYLRALMERHSGNVTAASQQAGMLRSALQRLLRKYELKSAEFRKPRRATVVAVPSRSQ
jgi:DNA-binding NtrC family response regulator